MLIYWWGIACINLKPPKRPFYPQRFAVFIALIFPSFAVFLYPRTLPLGISQTPTTSGTRSNQFKNQNHSSSRNVDFSSLYLRLR